MKNVVRFLMETRAELLKVVWPSYSDFAGSTVVVLMLVVAFALYLGASDFLLMSLAQRIF